MKRSTLYTALALTATIAVACNNKELHDPLPGDGAITVRINWAQGLNVPVEDGMRINIFSLHPSVPHYGRDDVAHHGGEVKLKAETTHKTFAYNYAGNNVKFVNESHPELLEAQSSPLSRATYARAFPNEQTIDQVTGDFHVGINESYTVLDTEERQYIDVHPANAVKTYTFEIRGVRGAVNIRETRGGIAGFSGSHFLATGAMAATPSTVLFNAKANGERNDITGSFRTFGRLDMTNNFTIEILYPAASGSSGIIQKTWDVTSQIDDGINYHIIIDNADIDIPDIENPDPGQNTGGWDVDLEDWNNETVPLN